MPEGTIIRRQQPWAPSVLRPSFPEANIKGTSNASKQARPLRTSDSSEMTTHSDRHYCTLIYYGTSGVICSLLQFMPRRLLLKWNEWNEAMTAIRDSAALAACQRL